MPPKNCVRVGNAGGYWGDDPSALYRQVGGGHLDYVTQDFLAEITMSILQKQRLRDPKLGYAQDFLGQFEAVLPLLTGTTTRIISNAGGINPLGCGEELERISLAAGVDSRIAVVLGDDLMPRLDSLVQEGANLDNMETGEHFSSIRDRVLSANAYLGAAPVVEALDLGARVVVTGRVTDTAIAAASPAFEFGWDPQDWNKLASAVVAGHILECGAHSTGGNLASWQKVFSFQNMGYPIVEFSADGSFVVTKHPSTGGQVNIESVTSQLVYEMGDPKRYLTPDVTADFTSFKLTDLGHDRVGVTQAKGSPPPDKLKVSVSYRDGFKAHGAFIVSSPQAVAKSYKIADILWRRLDIPFEETSVELVGYDSCGCKPEDGVEPTEILLRLGVRDKDRSRVAEFAKNLTSLILNTVSGIAIVGARPRIQEVVAYWPCLIPAEQVDCEIVTLTPRKSIQVPPRNMTAATEIVSDTPPVASTPTSHELPGAIEEVQLRKLCYARSGDKGDTCNIGLVARTPVVYDWLRSYMKPGKIKEFFQEICKGSVVRYEVPNLLALNFLLHNSLGGGGTVSLRVDPQGKTLAERLLTMKVQVPAAVVRSCATE